MPVHREASEVETRALDAYVKLRRASDSISARLASGIAEHGLTESQFGVLEALFHLGPMPQVDLARKILKSSGNITMVVDNLEKQALVKRVRGSSDRRYVSVELTTKGEELVRRIFPDHASTLVGFMSALSPAEQEQLATLCRKLGLGVSAR